MQQQSSKRSHHLSGGTESSDGGDLKCREKVSDAETTDAEDEGGAEHSQQNKQQNVVVMNGIEEVRKATVTESVKVILSPDKNVPPKVIVTADQQLSPGTVHTFLPNRVIKAFT